MTYTSVVGRALAGAVIAALAAAACSSAARTETRSTAPPAIPRAPAATDKPSVASTSSTVAAIGAGLKQRYETALPEAIQEAAATTAGDRLYVLGGYDIARNSSDRAFVFDGTSWHRAPALPVAVNHPGAATVGAAVYLAGGFTPGGATNRAFVLARGATQWRELAPMHHARGALALLALGGRLYAIGGRDHSAQLAPTEMYDPSNGRWSDTVVMPEPRNHLSGYADGGEACVAGGRTPQSSAAIDCLDVGNAQWRPRAVLPTATSGAAAAVLAGATIVAGGEPANETRLVPVVQILRDSAWTTMPMLVPRHGTAFAMFRGRLWMCGGATTPGFHAVPTCISLGPST